MPDVGATRARYRRILRFAARHLVSMWWFEIVLPRFGMARVAARGRGWRRAGVGGPRLSWPGDSPSQAQDLLQPGVGRVGVIRQARRGWQGDPVPSRPPPPRGALGATPRPATPPTGRGLIQIKHFKLEAFGARRIGRHFCRRRLGAARHHPS